jgi:hypothetical protein
MADSLNISDIRLYNLLKSKFGEKDAEDFVSLIKDEVQNSFEAKKDVLATKEDIAKLELKVEQMSARIAQSETKMILWAFVFWVTQLGAIFAFLKFIPH